MTGYWFLKDGERDHERLEEEKGEEETQREGRKKKGKTPAEEEERE